MALPASGTMTVDMIRNEFGGSNPFSISQYYRGGGRVPNSAANSNIPTSGTISFSNFYGASNIDQTPDFISIPSMYSSFFATNGTSPTPNWSFSNWYTLSGIDVPISVGFAASDISGGTTDGLGGCAFLATDVELLRGGVSIPGRASAVFSAEDSFTYSAGSPLTLQNGDQIRLKLMVGGRNASRFDEDSSISKDKGYVFHLINNTDGGAIFASCSSYGHYSDRVRTGGGGDPQIEI